MYARQAAISQISSCSQDFSEEHHWDSLGTEDRYFKKCPSDTKKLLCFAIHNFSKLYVNVVKFPVIIKKKKRDKKRLIYSCTLIFLFIRLSIPALLPSVHTKGVAFSLAYFSSALKKCCAREFAGGIISTIASCSSCFHLQSTLQALV